MIYLIITLISSQMDIHKNGNVSVCFCMCAHLNIYIPNIQLYFNTIMNANTCILMIVGLI